jgi:hypothetical protein
MEMGTYTTGVVIIIGICLVFLVIKLIANFFNPLFSKIFRRLAPVTDTPVIEILSEVFRTVGLKSPNLRLSKKNSDRHPLRLSGFLFLPGILKATLVFSEEIFKRLNPEELKIVLSSEATQSKYGNRFMSTQKFFFKFFVSAFLVWTFIFYPYISCTPDQYHPFISILFFLTAFIGFFYFKRKARQFYIFETDFNTIRMFNHNPDEYFSVMEKIGPLSPSNLDRRKFYLVASEKNKDSDKLPNFSILQKALSPTAIVITALNWIGPFTFYAVHYGPSHIMTSAIQSQDYTAIRELSAKPENLEMRDPFYNGATPALIAAESGELQILYSIIVAGGNYTETDDLDRDILFYAIQGKNRESVVKYVLQTDIDVNHQDFTGRSALDYARQIGNTEIETALIQKGANSRLPANDVTSLKTSFMKRLVEKFIIF